MNVLWGMSKEQAQIYRQRAAECEALAKHYEAMPLAKYFRELAEQWRQLADPAPDLRQCLVCFGDKARLGGLCGASQAKPRQ
jgi:hypothetical protein